MSGFFALPPEGTLRYVRRVDVYGFKFLYQLLSISPGSLRVSEIAPPGFRARVPRDCKLDLVIAWDLGVSILLTLLLRLIPRRAISFALVGGPERSGGSDADCASADGRGGAGLQTSAADCGGGSRQLQLPT